MNGQAVHMIAIFSPEGKPEPLKFKFENEQKELVTVKVDRIARRDINRFVGNKMHVFRCESIDSGISHSYELRYEIDACRWFLYD